MDKRLTIIFVLLILSGLLYVSTNFKEIMDNFSSTPSNIAAATSDTILSGGFSSVRNSLMGGVSGGVSGGGVPSDLLKSMQNITNMLN
jgi:hypothetical protein